METNKICFKYRGDSGASKVTDYYLAHVSALDTERKQTVATHLLETGEYAAQFASKIGLEDAGCIIGLCHDLGKYSSKFQRYIKHATGVDYDRDDSLVDEVLARGSVDHSTAGAQLIHREMRKLLPKYGKGELCGQILSLCVASHHSGLIDCATPDDYEKLLKRLSKSDDDSHLSEAFSNADIAIKQRIKELCNTDILKALFSCIHKPFETLPNAAEYQSLSTQINIGFIVKFLFSCLIDADRLSSAEFENPVRKGLKLDTSRRQLVWEKVALALEAKLNSFGNDTQVDKIRKSISEQCANRATDSQGIYTLTVPTGGGKTLSSLRYAILHAIEHKLERIIFVIPFTSIIEQNAQAVRNLFDSDPSLKGLVLEHHSNIEPENQNWESKIYAENWELPIVFTTSVQVLESLFAGGTRGVRRLHTMAKAVLVFDEIQALPFKCIRLFCHAANFLTQQCNSTVVLCSATQPTLDKLPKSQRGYLKLAANHEIIGQPQKLYEFLKRVEVKPSLKPAGYDISDACDLIVQKFEQSQSCLVIGNTKQWVKAIYSQCSTSVPSAALFHLSTNMCSHHRKIVIHNIKARLKNGLPVLCVSTQLIEAGVDISFKRVIRTLAGLDSIAQAAGRCNRNGELTDDSGTSALGEVTIINPQNEQLTMLPTIEAGKQLTQNLIDEQNYSDLLSLDAMNEYFNRYLQKLGDSIDFQVEDSGVKVSLLEMLSKRIDVLRNEKEQRMQCLPTLKQSFMTAGKCFKAIDAPTKSLLVKYSKSEHLIGALCSLDKHENASEFFDTLKLAQSFSVNVFEQTWMKLHENEAIFQIGDTGIFYTDCYDDEFGLSDKSELSDHIL